MSAAESLPTQASNVVDTRWPEVEVILDHVEQRVAGVRRSEVERAVLDELARFQGARVTSFIPILVERAVIVRLRGRLRLAADGANA